MTEYYREGGYVFGTESLVNSYDIILTVDQERTLKRLMANGITKDKALRMIRSMRSSATR